MKHLFLFVVLSLGLLLGFVIVTNIVFYVGTKAHIYNDVAEVPSVEVALIPGASVSSDGVLSPIFIDRVNTAVRLYEAGKVSKILVSGDNSTDSNNEVNPVRLYLIREGIPDADIFLDHAGFDTYSTMYRARDIFGVTSLIVATQSFHLPRSVFIARRLGMEAYGLNADLGNILFRNNIREVLANEKAVFDLIFNRKPKFLGEKIPITDDGRSHP